MAIYIQRIYEDKQQEGLRILVDRVWPRGIAKDDAHLDHWIKEVAPTSELRKWFNHDPKLYAAFKEKYKKELLENIDQKQAFEELQNKVSETDKDIILLFAAKDKKHNQAIVLQELLQ
ncbi:DUF488 domain-containing protein [Staphylococcus xylosus]|uniref:DUF488 domain-containing protein n=1 Tax=Staphylococcus xylosus TaxID=1288 RepID=UPI00049AFCB0|nr:DUF488 family protein [Staphylococcus xylosus]AID41748.1 hypothetical protein SXYLSMQ121_0316 [Staphylococcus xylosus]RIM83885.1 DUF488 family protein [Staphylococcus xylosus]